METAGYLLLALSGVGIICLLASAVRALRLGRVKWTRPAAQTEPVSILKPLYGAEPQLYANLSTFLVRDFAGPIQLVCGVREESDPAIAVVEALKVAHPTADIELVVNPTTYGSNAKVSNLVNIAALAKYDVLILSDSDMAVPRDYVARVLDALQRPGVGAVTCLYRGRGVAGGWSRLVAMGLSQHFLPSVLLGMMVRLATPCMGSTIAFRRKTLEAVGGFRAFGDLLADDYAIGASVRRVAGLKIALPDIILTHGCTDASFGALVRQELRWNRTVYGISRPGFIGSFVLHPLPLALIGMALTRFAPIGLLFVLAALVARAAVALAVDRGAEEPVAPLWWLPARDLLSFGLFLLTFFSRSVDWRGAQFTIESDGRLAAARDSST